MDDKNGSRLSIEGYLLDVDYLLSDDGAVIRLAIRGTDGRSYEVVDRGFHPYFYLLPSGAVKAESIRSAAEERNPNIRVSVIEPTARKLGGKERTFFRVEVGSPLSLPRVSGSLSGMGIPYENDIPFARKYLIDREIVPLTLYTFDVESSSAGLTLLSARKSDSEGDDVRKHLKVLCFDIETYNPVGMPRPEKDAIVMISYSYSAEGVRRSGLITFKEIPLSRHRETIIVERDERSMLERFALLLNELDVDIISGYNSANFDIKYMINRSAAIGMELNLSRFRGETSLERHGMVDKVKIGGRIHLDVYQIVKFIVLVGASESILKLDSYTLRNVYEAISGDKKLSIDRNDVYRMWDGSGEELATLADYCISDSLSLHAVYDVLVPITLELSRVTGNVPSDVAVSTTSQLVEFMLMLYAHRYGEIVPNKPDDREIRARQLLPYEGAYVKTPNPGIYENMVVLDFRGLYPSIIISHNIDPSSICTSCDDYFESPTGIKFDKKGRYISPMIVKMLVEQRSSVKKLYKKDPENIVLGSRSQALKIIANSFYGYLGYARARWYSRECASSVTAYGRQYIQGAIAKAEERGFRVLYSDTDSIVMLLNEHTKEEALSFMGEVNSSLPEMMELELEDFYRRGLFVGKKNEKGEVTGAKKKYAFISEGGHIKIKGFELVRRDWSKIAQSTQRQVLETILKDGSAEKAAEIVKEVVKRLKAGEVPLSDLVISTQLGKSIESYDGKSPELSAAKKAIEKGFKTKEEVEHSVLGYVITKGGQTISDKALLYGMAKDYDPDYYINNQVLPAIMRILRELNFNEEELKGLGKQKKL